MKASTRSVYKCDHCDRRPYLSRSACARHEAMCFGNPDRSKCPACNKTGRVSVADYQSVDCEACETWSAIQSWIREGKSFYEAACLARAEGDVSE